jgi:hypothetical protein
MGGGWNWLRIVSRDEVSYQSPLRLLTGNSTICFDECSQWQGLLCWRTVRLPRSIRPWCRGVGGVTVRWAGGWVRTLTFSVKFSSHKIVKLTIPTSPYRITPLLTVGMKVSAQGTRNACQDARLHLT